MALSSAAIVQLIMLVTDLMVIAPLQFAKLKQAVADGTLTDDQIDAMISASETSSDALINEIDNL